MSIRSYIQDLDKRGNIAKAAARITDTLVSDKNSVLDVELANIRMFAGLPVGFSFIGITAAQVKMALVCSDADAAEFAGVLKACQLIRDYIQARQDSGELPANTVS